MILGIGTDIVTLERMEAGLRRFGRRFAEKILAEDELSLLPEGERLPPYLAGRWAAKEACVKALGTGFAKGIGPRQIAVCNNEAGAPYLVLSGEALSQCHELGVTKMHVSVSHDRLSAVAFVVLEGE